VKDARPYLRDILTRIELIREFTLAGRDDFLTSRKTQESVIRCFEVIGEAVKRLPEELTANQPSIPWKAFAGFRDVLIHQYDKIDLPVIWDSITNDLDPLEMAVRTLLDLQDDSTESET